MPEIESAQRPLLLRMRGSSVNDPRQAFRNVPLSAIAETRRGAAANPDTDTLWGANRSLLRIVNVPLTAPSPVGRKRTTMSI